MLISSKYSDGQFWKITAENVIARQEGDFPIDPVMLIMQMLLQIKLLQFRLFNSFLGT
jgi:hypothetical protein